MKSLAICLAMLAAGLLLLAPAGCDNGQEPAAPAVEGPEDFGRIDVDEQARETAEEAEEMADEAIDTADDAMEEAADDVEGAADEAEQAAQDAVEAADEAMEEATDEDAN